MGKLKIKQKKKAFIPYTNQQSHSFAQSIQNCQKELKEMERNAYEDGFNTGEDWSNTINTVTTMMALRKLYGFSTKRLLDVVKSANEYVQLANEGKMSVLSMMQDIEKHTDVRFDEKNKNLVKEMGV
jgi:Mg2+ and Co2+ transporter CorA